MFHPDQYQILDFGKGEKLESFGGLLLQRETPSVAAHVRRSGHVDWRCDLRFRQSKGQPGQWQGTPPQHWQIQHNQKTFLLKPTPAGQIGVFPEQADNWQWIENLPQDLTGLTALNLFGYTGGTTLALASRGARVVHVDGARNVMKWARENAAASGMDGLPIRWIVDDAMSFVQRESKRGSKYDILVADPPSYGTGPKKQRWKFEQDFPRLLQGLAEISSRLKLVLLTWHTTGIDDPEIENSVRQILNLSHGPTETIRMNLQTSGGKQLPSGRGLRFASN